MPSRDAQTRPVSDLTTPAPPRPEIGGSRDPVGVFAPPERTDEESRTSLAVARGRLARLVPGRNARTETSQAVEFDAAARKAYKSALNLGTGVRLAPAPPAARPAGAPTTARPTAPAATPPAKPEAAPAPAALVPPPTAPSATPTAAAASWPTSAGAASGNGAEPAAAPSTSAWAAPPRPSAEQSAAPVGATPRESPASPRRRQPGETAPDFLLRTPTSVTPVADDFFNGLIRRIEGDR